MGEGDKQPVDKLAEDVVNNDVAKNGGRGRPGKEPKHVALVPWLPAGRYAIPAAVVLAGLIALVVVALVGGFNGSSKRAATSPTTTAAATTPVVSPVTPGGSLDSCLVGVWRSQPLAWKVALPNQTNPGGADAIVTFKADGTEIVDMANATPHAVGITTNTWRGTTVAQVAAKNGTVSAAKVLRTDATVHTVVPTGNPPVDKTQRVFPFVLGLGGNPSNKRYEVTQLTLTYEPTTYATLHLRRISPLPAADACGVPRTRERGSTTTTP
jgi:hypothetical protein